MRQIVAAFTIVSLLAGANAHGAGARAATENFLGSAWRDPMVTLREQNVKAFGSAGFSNPFEKMQVRLAQNKYADDRKAGLRAYPRGWTEYGLLRQLNEQGARMEDMLFREQLGKSLHDRYLALVEFRYAGEIKRLRASLAQSLKRAMAMQMASARADAAKARDLLKAREAAEEAQLKLAEAEGKLRYATERLKVLDSQTRTDRLSLADWPEATELNGILDQFGSRGGGESSLESRIARETAIRTRNSMHYDVAKDDRIFDYFEFSIAQDGPETKYGIEVAINIPGFAGSDHGARDKARQIVKYEIEAVEAQRESATDMATQRTIVIKASEWYRQASSSEDSQALERIKSLARRNDPMLANALERDAVQRKLLAAESSRDAFIAYVEYLEASGTLAEKPRVNFLSRDLRELKP